MEDYLKCVKCSDDDHEGQFCRCEGRNIRIAKEQRSRNESSWQNKRFDYMSDIYELDELIENLKKCHNQGRHDNHIIGALLCLSLELKQIKENTKGITSNDSKITFTS